MNCTIECYQSCNDKYLTPSGRLPQNLYSRVLGGDTKSGRLVDRQAGRLEGRQTGRQVSRQAKKRQAGGRLEAG